MTTTHSFPTPDGVWETNATNSALTELFGLARWVGQHSYGNPQLLDARGGVRFADLCTGSPNGEVTSLNLVVEDGRIEANIHWPGLFNRTTYIRLDGDADVLVDTLERHVTPGLAAHLVATAVTSAHPSAMTAALAELAPTIAAVGSDHWTNFTTALNVIGQCDGDLDAISARIDTVFAR